MKQLIIILLLFGFIGCKTNPKVSEKQSTDLLMNNSKEITHSPKNFQTLYPDLCDQYLSYPDIDTSVIAFCNGTFRLNANDKTSEFLKKISLRNDKFFPLYFQIFNYACDNSDGALSEMMPDPCLDFLLNYPAEVIGHFTTNKNDLNNYASMLGYEFYFKEKGTSDMKMTYETFKAFLSENIDLSNEKVFNTYTSFCNKIESTMKDMN